MVYYKKCFLRKWFFLEKSISARVKREEMTAMVSRAVNEVERWGINYIIKLENIIF